MSNFSSRRNSSTTLPPSPTTSTPPTPTGKSAPLTPSFSQKNLKGTPRKINPVRRCQSMRYPNNKGQYNGNYGSGTITPSPSLRARRVSSTPSSLENGKSDTEFMKYYQYKTNKADPISLLNIVIADDLHGLKDNICRVLVVGLPGCGKTSLVSQFSHHLEEQKVTGSNGSINGGHNKTCKNGNGVDKNGSHVVLHFREIISLENCLPRSPIALYQPDAYIVVYAVNCRESFEGAKDLIEEIQKWDDVESKPVILVANKTDLVRSRLVSKQEGRQLAIANNCKYIETSCAISLNVDFLLAGIGAQFNLKNSKQGQLNHRKPNIFRRLLKKAALNKSKSCDNLHVL